MSKERFNHSKAQIGQKTPPYQVKVDGKIYRKYNRLIGEINPIHFNKAYAQKLGFENVVVAGNFLFTYIPKWILDWIGDASAIKNITIKFDNPVYIDDEIIHTGKITEINKDTVSKKIICKYEVKKLDGTFTSSGKITLNYPN